MPRRSLLGRLLSSCLCRIIGMVALALFVWMAGPWLLEKAGPHVKEAAFRLLETIKPFLRKWLEE